MYYSEYQQRWINISGIIMLVYAIVSLIYLRLNGFSEASILLFSINIVNFLLFLFPELDKRITAAVCIFVGVFSIFLLSDLIVLVGAILGVYGLLLLIRLYFTI